MPSTSMLTALKPRPHPGVRTALIIVAIAAVGMVNPLTASSIVGPDALDRASAMRLVEDVQWLVPLQPSGAELAWLSSSSWHLDSAGYPHPLAFPSGHSGFSGRLRKDALEIAPLSPGTAKKPGVPVKLTRDQRAIARHITRSYRVAGDSVEEFVHHAYKAAREVRLNPHLILAVMAVESSFDPNARSAAGAQGLMQVLTRVHTRRFEPFGGAAAAYDPPANIEVGARILSEYVNRFGGVAPGLKAYVGAALLPTDGGYGTKVLSRQAEFDAVVSPGAPPATEAKADDIDTSLQLRRARLQ